MLGTQKRKATVTSCSTGKAWPCRVQHSSDSFTFKLTLQQICFVFQGTALNIPLSQELAARPFRRVACELPQEALQPRHSHQRHHTGAQPVSCFWQKPEPGRIWQDATSAVKFRHPLLILPQYKSREMKNLMELKS